MDEFGRKFPIEKASGLPSRFEKVGAVFQRAVESQSGLGLNLGPEEAVGLALWGRGERG